MRDRIRAAALTGYAQVATALGLDTAALLSTVGLSRRVLLDPDTLIPAASVSRLLERAARAADVDDFGLRMAETRRLSNLGPLGLVAGQAPTLRAMLATIVRYLRLHNESLYLRIEEADGVVVLSQTLGTGRAQPSRQAIELGVGALHRIVGSILGDAWRPLRVCFAHGPPRDTRTHRRVFGPGTALEFDAAFDGLVCRATDLDRPIPAADPTLARYARRYLDELARSAGREGLPAQVRHLVRTLLPSGRCTVDRVAESLGVDRRTVHRHLAREGTTFTRVLVDARRELAERYVAQPARPLSDVAELLGFATQSAFSEWFRSQYGCSASAWRAARATPPARTAPRR
ncbi:MAG: AraC family transcriptional regulator [Burkholderiales bacterium]